MARAWVPRHVPGYHVARALVPWHVPWYPGTCHVVPLPVNGYLAYRGWVGSLLRGHVPGYHC
jgi:hypothetical protein